ncbi:MAG: sensory histidine kinase AtoS [Methanomassiliicoccales archaeon PtaU1.Bin030]|nr:MAG: sensory histidine kinase AtoS [Methanomassiliicoccales archaeon PtaU1.Bin030]
MRRSEEEIRAEALRQKIIGLGETSHRKSYYPQLQEQIDELHATLKALQDSENKYRTLIENVNVGIFRSDIKDKGRLVQANPAMCRILGYEDERAILEADPDEFYQDPQDRRAIIDELKKEGRIKDKKVRMRPRSGGTIIVSMTMTALYDEMGDISFIDGVIEDITEKEMKEEALRQANKKWNLLSSITRHDINNQAMVLDGYLTLAMERTTDAEVRKLLSKARSSVQSIERHVAFAKDYQDIGINAPRWFDLRESLINALIPLDKASLSVRLEVDDYTIFADPMIGKVFYNLAQNVVRHSKGSVLEISTKEEDGSLVLSFQDNGVGIRDKSRLFMRSNSTSGFGLFLSKEILSITGVDIRETGEAGKGARFEIIFAEGQYRSPAASQGLPKQ